METIAISAPVTTVAAQTTSTQTQSTSGMVSFSELLSGLTAGGQSSQASQTGGTMSEGLSWRDMQAMVQAYSTGSQLAQDATSTDLGLGDLLKQLLAMLDEFGENKTAELLEAGEDVDAWQQMVDRWKRQIEQMMYAGGQFTQAEQLTLVLAQLTNQTLMPQMQEDGTLALTLPQTDLAMQQLLNSDPADLLAQLTGQPAENFQNLVSAQMQTTAATALETTAQAAGQLPIVEVTTNTTAIPQDADTAFQASVRSAMQQMEATATGTAKTTGMTETDEATEASAKPDTKLDIDELQKQVDSGVHFKNTAYAAAVQTEAKAEPVNTPLLTQVQDGILKGIEQGEQQFNIKLAPEGLGQLEVQLLKTAEGTVMNIVTKNAETQRLLAAELNQLRETLKPYNVEVQSVLTEQQADFLSRQRSFEQQQAWQNQQRAGNTIELNARRGTATAEEVEAIQAQPQYMTAAALDTYI